MRYGNDELWEFHEPYKVLESLPGDWFEQVASSKWTERKEALEKLKALLTEHPRLEPNAAYGEIVDTLSKIVGKDSNVMVLAVAANCLEGLALGLRKKFGPFALSVIPILLLKFKEKKQVVVTALVSTLDAVAPAVKDFEPLMDDIMGALMNKNPGIRVQTSLFLNRLFIDVDPKAVPKKSVKRIIDALIANMGESDPEVRLKAAMALGSIMYFVGEKPMKSLLAQINDDSSKMDKIRQYFTEAQKAAEAAKETEEPAPSKKSSPKVAGTDASGETEGDTVAEPGQEEEVEPDPWDFHEPKNVLELLPKDFPELIGSSKWSERKEALEQLKALLLANPRPDHTANYGEIISTLSKLVSKDSNVIVVSLSANCLELLAKGLRKHFTPFSLSVLPILLQKFKEKKQTVVTALVSAVDAVAPTLKDLELACEDIVSALTSKSPGIKIQTSLFLQRYLKRLTLKALPKKVLKTLCEPLVKNASESDPDVRDSSCAALGSAMKVVGEKIMAIFLAPISDDPVKMDKIKKYCAEAEASCPKVAEPPPTAPTKTQHVKGQEPPKAPKTKGKTPAAEEPTESKEEKPVKTKAPTGTKALEETKSTVNLEPVDILQKLSKRWQFKLESKDSKEKIKALQELNDQLLANPNLIVTPQYKSVISKLSEIVAGDLSLEAVILGAKCLENLSAGLKESFSEFWEKASRFTPKPPTPKKGAFKKDQTIDGVSAGRDKPSTDANSTNSENSEKPEPTKEIPKNRGDSSMLVGHEDVNELLEMPVPCPVTQSRALLDARKHWPRRHQLLSSNGQVEEPKSSSRELSDIFLIIADTTHSKRGINLLHDYLKKHPDTDLSKHMSKSSVHFQNYINRGLESLRTSDGKENKGTGRKPSQDYLPPSSRDESTARVLAQGENVKSPPPLNTEKWDLQYYRLRLEEAKKFTLGIKK